MIYFTAHTLKCVCHCRRAMFRVLGMYNFASKPTVWLKFDPKLGPNMNCNYSRESLKGAKHTF